MKRNQLLVGLSILLIFIGNQPFLGSSGSGLIENGDLEPIKIMNYNIQDSGEDPDWKEVVREENPDILVLVETGDWDDLPNDGFTTSDFNQLVAELNSFFPSEDPYVAYTDQNIPYENSGEAIFSRFPILDFNQINTVQLDDGSAFIPSHDFLHAEIDLNKTIIHVIGVHLKCCDGATNEEKREKAQEGINNYMDDLGDVPIIYTGDLNTFSPEDTGDLAPSGNLGYDVIPMLIDPLDPNACTEHEFFDVFRTLNPSDPGYSYIHIDSRIDYIFANEHFTDLFLNSTVGDTPSATISSDHRSVDAFFLLEPEITTTTTTSITSDVETTTTTLETTQQESTSEPRSSSIFSLSILIGLGAIFLVRKRGRG